MKNIGRLFRTVVHLKPVQIFYQVRRRIWKPKYVHRAAPDAVSPHRWIVEPIPRVTCLDRDVFCFLNLSKRFSSWCDVSDGMLWAYNLNYFDWLNQKAVSEEECVSWVDRFIDGLDGNGIGLDAYPTSLRIENWIKFFCRCPEQLTKRRCDCLFSQYRHLQQSIEYHLLGNHLLENLCSLYIASLFFNDFRYHGLILKKLLKELGEEILADGGHFEQSPMYHCIVLDRLLDCINAGKSSAWCYDGEVEQLVIAVSPMLGWLSAMCYADGTYPLFNDAADGIAPSPAEIFGYAERLCIAWEKAELGESGYVHLSNGKYEAFADRGNIAAAYQPGHTHSDVFSYELRIDGQPFVIDTGISTYNKTGRRQYERSSFAHNSVTIDGQGPYEVWGGFRVGARGTVHGDVCRFPSGAVHRRDFSLKDDCFIVEDSVSDGTAVSRIHLSPEVSLLEVDKLDSGAAVVLTTAGKIIISGAFDVTVKPCLVSHEYNRFQESNCIEITFEHNVKYSII